MSESENDNKVNLDDVLLSAADINRSNAEITTRSPRRSVMRKNRRRSAPYASPLVLSAMWFRALRVLTLPCLQPKIVLWYTKTRSRRLVPVSSARRPRLRTQPRRLIIISPVSLTPVSRLEAGSILRVHLQLLFPSIAPNLFRLPRYSVSSWDLARRMSKTS